MSCANGTKIKTLFCFTSKADKPAVYKYVANGH